MSRRHINAPPPRAGFAVDAVLQRGGGVVDVRKLYIGPRGLAVEDLVEVLASVAAASLMQAVDAEMRGEAKQKLLELLDQRIDT